MDSLIQEIDQAAAGVLVAQFEQIEAQGKLHRTRALPFELFEGSSTELAVLPRDFFEFVAFVVSVGFSGRFGVSDLTALSVSFADAAKNCFVEWPQQKGKTSGL